MPAVSKNQRLLLSHGGSCLAWGLKSMNSRVELSWINWLYDLGKMPNLPGQHFLHLKCRGNWENSGCCCSVTQSCPTLFDPMNCSTLLSFIISQSLLKLMSVESMMPSNHLTLFCPLLFLLSIFPSIRIFSNESVLIKWPNYWNFSFSISPSNEYSGLISFRIDWFDLLAVQGTLKSLLQHHSSKASILQCSVFFMVQLSHPYMTTAKSELWLDRTLQQIMFLLFNMLSSLVIDFLPRSQNLLISWMQSPSAVIFGAQENKVCHCFHCFPIYLPWNDGT